MGSGIALLLWTAKLPSPFLFWYHRYVSILKYNTAGVCLAIKKAMPVNGHRLFDHGYDVELPLQALRRQPPPLRGTSFQRKEVVIQDKEIFSP